VTMTTWQRLEHNLLESPCPVFAKPIGWLEH
jgi:hypothetical protein